MAESSEGPKLMGLSQIEVVINEYAAKVASKQSIPAHHFRVHLVTELRGVMAMTAGEVVGIYLLWPDAQPNINTLLRGAFTAIQRFRLRRTMEIVPVALIKREAIERKKWYRERFGEMGDILSELLPRQRIRVTTQTITTLHDVVTGEEVSFKHSSKPERYDGENVGLWLELTRVVRQRHPDVADVEEIVSDTPELDQSQEQA